MQGKVYLKKSKMGYFFSSESVSEGHPDKVCDQISDAVLDQALTQDPLSRVAVECFATTGLVLVGGEVSSKAVLDVPAIVRQTLQDIGYTHPDYGIDAGSCCVLNTIHQQSKDIAQGVNEGEGLHKQQGAGDQGMMFGYACRQTDSLMPMPIYLSHQLVKQLSVLRKSKALPYLRPDAKAQVTVAFEGRVPKRIHTLVISTQHNPEIEWEQINKDVIEHVIKPTIPAQFLDANTRYFINPTGRFVVGGPQGDTGLTGRKIIVDTYGGWASHGGGAFSGKDATKVDRSGAYMARYIAKNIVHAQLAEEVEVQIAYAIGVEQPVSIYVNTRGPAKVSDDRLVRLIQDYFDLSPKGIAKTLGLTQPIFRQTAAYGHFGREDLDLPWERTNMSDQLRGAI